MKERHHHVVVFIAGLLKDTASARDALASNGARVVHERAAQLHNVEAAAGKLSGRTPQIDRMLPLEAKEVTRRLRKLRGDFL